VTLVIGHPQSHDVIPGWLVVLEDISLIFLSELVLGCLFDVCGQC
jgi:hypothetical protein